MNSPVYLLFYNIFVVLLYGFDKLFAKLNLSRIPEKVLLSFAIACGSPGALTGMVLFHHKISKPRFRYIVSVSFIVHCGILFYTIFTK